VIPEKEYPMTRRLERDIEAVLEARTGRECVFMPSGRFGIHLAFRLLLSPGDRVLMSPLEDDTVFFGALAAGLRPVMAPISIDDGNMHLEAVDNRTWSSIAAVLTGNTYGLPDRVAEIRSVCDRLEIPLVEDAAHALETEVGGRPVGSFGAASLFSLSKHIRGRGGVLSLGEGVSRSEVVRLRDELMIPAPAIHRVVTFPRSAAIHITEALQVRDYVRRAMMHPIKPVPWRIPLRPHQLEHALLGTGLELFDEWMQTSYPDYRMRQRASVLKRTLALLHALERDRAGRIAGVLRLRELNAVAPAARAGAPLPLFRVPLLVEDRDAVALELRRHGINLYGTNVYAPPLDDYSGPDFLEPSPTPEAARWWSAHVLPINPHDAERVVKLVARRQIRLAPAAPPASA
jgi:DegT/DnrJ/EryC1/StrS aminotransferase family